MSRIRHSVFHPFLLAAFVATVAIGSVHAQQRTDVPAAVVELTGTTEAGGLFTGTFLIRRFEAQAANGGIVAVGSVTGVLNGRQFVTQAELPLSVSPGAAAPTIGPTANAPAACDVVHIELAPFAFRTLGSVVLLDAAGFDIAASMPDMPVVTGRSPASPSTPSTTAATPGRSVAGLPGTSVPMTLPRSTLLTTPEGTSPVPTSPVTTLRPGTITPPQGSTTTPAAAAPASRQQLDRLLCSISTMSQSGAPAAQLVPLLNQVLAALG